MSDGDDDAVQKKSPRDSDGDDGMALLFARCSERAVKTAKLVEAMRRAHFSIAEAKMTQWAASGGASIAEFADQVDFDADRTATLRIACSDGGLSVIVSSSSEASGAPLVAKAFAEVVRVAVDLVQT